MGHVFKDFVGDVGYGGLKTGRSWNMDGCSGSEDDLILPAEEETEGYGILGERGVSRVSKSLNIKGNRVS